MMKKIFIIILFLIFSQILFSQNNIVDFELVKIKGGSIKLGLENGDKDAKISSKIRISSFSISKYEITNSKYCEFLNAKNYDTIFVKKYISLNGKWRNLTCRINYKSGKYFVEEGFGNYPVNFVNWYGANEFCIFWGGRLPTEAEWEFVARNGKYNKKYDFSEIELEKQAWFNKNSENVLHEVGVKNPNKLGVYDMYGNVSEWCADWYDADFYKNISKNNPRNTKKAKFKVQRGGSFVNSAKILNPINRRATFPKFKKVTMGFRIVF